MLITLTRFHERQHYSLKNISQRLDVLSRSIYKNIGQVRCFATEHFSHQHENHSVSDRHILEHLVFTATCLIWTTKTWPGSHIRLPKSLFSKTSLFNTVTNWVRLWIAQSLVKCQEWGRTQTQKIYFLHKKNSLLFVMRVHITHKLFHMLHTKIFHKSNRWGKVAFYCDELVSCFVWTHWSTVKMLSNASI